MGDNPIASIIILTYNNPEITSLCIESIYAKTKFPFELIIVDNASNDDTPQYLREIKSSKENLRLILNDRNMGFARGNNQGANASTGEYIVLLNNDTIVTSSWLTRLINHLRDPEISEMPSSAHRSERQMSLHPVQLPYS